ncbi:MAG: hypothetical protein GY940_40435 [bacterium]|nr:hypothetical protein [bacterium]
MMAWGFLVILPMGGFLEYYLGLFVSIFNWIVAFAAFTTIILAWLAISKHKSFYLQYGILGSASIGYIIYLFYRIHFSLDSHVTFIFPRIFSTPLLIALTGSLLLLVASVMCKVKPDGESSPTFTGVNRVKKQILMAKLIILVGFIPGVILVQANYLDWKIIPNDQDEFRKHGVEFERNDDWIIGYTIGTHGTFLVKTPAAGYRDPVENRSIGYETYKAMVADFESIPEKTIYEGLLYVVWITLVLFAAPWAVGRIKAHKRLKKKILAWLLGIFCSLVLLSPLLIMGYGYGWSANLYYTCPYPTSYSIREFEGILFLTEVPGETISYHQIIEIILLPGAFLSPFFSWLLSTWGFHLIFLGGVTAAFILHIDRIKPGLKNPAEEKGTGIGNLKAT